MNHVHDTWASNIAKAREDGLYIMKCFTSQSSTPDSKVAEILRDAFFKCSHSSSFPIVSDLGIRDSKAVRVPHPDFTLFMKQCPVLDSALLSTDSTLITDLPKQLKVTDYTFRDVKNELAARIFTEDEMIACVSWWVRLSGQSITEVRERLRKEFLSVAKFNPMMRGHREIMLCDIQKFVNSKGWGSYIQYLDPLPPDTIPFTFTQELDPNAVQTSLGWQEMTIIDWITYLISPELDEENDIRRSLPFTNRIFGVLQELWPSLKPSVKEKITELLRDIELIPTSQGRKKPEEAYFSEADLFGDLAIIDNLDYNKQMLQELGVQRNIPWRLVKPRWVDFRAMCCD